MDEASRMARANSMDTQKSHSIAAKRAVESQTNTRVAPISRATRLMRRIRPARRQAEPANSGSISVGHSRITRLVGRTTCELVASADSKLATDLVDMIAPGKSVEWFIEFAKRNPDMKVTDAHHLWCVRRSREAPGPALCLSTCWLRCARFRRDVRKIGDSGIRLKERPLIQLRLLSATSWLRLWVARWRRRWFATRSQSGLTSGTKPQP